MNLEKELKKITSQYKVKQIVKAFNNEYGNKKDFDSEKDFIEYQEAKQKALSDYFKVKQKEVHQQIKTKVREYILENKTGDSLDMKEYMKLWQQAKKLFDYDYGIKWKEYQKEYRKEYQKSDKYKECIKKYRTSDKYKEYKKEYNKEYRKSDKHKEYEKSDKRKTYMKEYCKEYYLKKKLEKQKQELIQTSSIEVTPINFELLPILAMVC